MRCRELIFKIFHKPQAKFAEEAAFCKKNQGSQVRATAMIHMDTNCEWEAVNVFRWKRFTFPRHVFRSKLASRSSPSWSTQIKSQVFGDGWWGGMWAFRMLKNGKISASKAKLFEAWRNFLRKKALRKFEKKTCYFYEFHSFQRKHSLLLLIGWQGKIDFLRTFDSQFREYNENIS